jgi:hypothetical protein
MSRTCTDPVHELNHRSGNGLEVVLVWYPCTNTVAVHVFDTSTMTAFRADVDAADAADAFLHPFAYVSIFALAEVEQQFETDRTATIA